MSVWLERWGSSGMALMAAYAGQPVAAERALRRVDELSPSVVDLYDADIWHARSALAALRGDADDARRIAQEGLVRSRDLGRPFDEAVACTALLRLGAGTDDVLGRLDDLGRAVGGLVQLFADAALARARGDVAALGEVVERYAAAGAATLAAASAADAARLATRHGDTSAADRRSTRARELAAELETRGEFLATVDHALLSRREHDVATMAAAGVEVTVIAERLLLPTHVVAQMLRQACDKLDVTGIDDLAAALAAGPAT